MYSASDLFRKAYKYCTANYSRVAILSAKYGLVLPTDIIDPYNVTLNDLNSEEVKAWSEKVFKQMTDNLDLKTLDTVFFHAGKNYRKYLIPKLEGARIKCKIPLEKLGIGKQKAWYLIHNC